jgi:hypothetical protein
MRSSKIVWMEGLRCPSTCCQSVHHSVQHLQLVRYRKYTLYAQSWSYCRSVEKVVPNRAYYIG